MISLQDKQFAFVTAALPLCVAAILAACSAAPGGSNMSGTGPTNGSSGGPSVDGGGGGSSHPTLKCEKATGTGAVSKTAGTCANPTVPLVFSPMYGASIPGQTLRSFSIPAVTDDGCAATWSLSDPTQAILHVESFVNGTSTTPGVMITVAPGTTGSGSSRQVTVIATESDGTCGSTVLTITQNTQDDWTIGNARYNQGASLTLPASGASGGANAPDSGYIASNGAGFIETDGGVPCSSCHSQNETSGKFHDVAHTPEQTGGFSDSDMRGIVLNGEVPDGGYFDPSVIDPTCKNAGTALSPNMPSCGLAAYSEFQAFHKWSDITPAQLPGMICYLRSLTPEGQSGGGSNFGH